MLITSKVVPREKMISAISFFASVSTSWFSGPETSGFSLVGFTRIGALAFP